MLQMEAPSSKKLAELGLEGLLVRRAVIQPELIPSNWSAQGFVFDLTMVPLFRHDGVEEIFD
jgi:hypothetical protein